MREFKYHRPRVQIQGENTNKLECIVLRGVPSRRNCKTYPVKYLIKEGSSRHSRRTLLQADKFPLAGVSTPDCKYVSAFKSTSCYRGGRWRERENLCVDKYIRNNISYINSMVHFVGAGSRKGAFSYILFLTTVSAVKSSAEREW